MDTPQTCGRGLADHSALPMKLAELTDAVRAVLEHHTKALDVSDPSSKKELDAYRKLVKEHADAAAQLRSIATEMAGYRDLPMGRHDPAAMAGPAGRDAFEAFVTREEELAGLLEERLKNDRHMLTTMRA